MLEKVTVECMYSCALCGLKRVKCQVTAREEKEDIVHWVREVAAVELSADHSKRSPDCHPKVLSEVLIPTDGVEYLGGPTIQ